MTALQIFTRLMIYFVNINTRWHKLFECVTVSNVARAIKLILSILRVGRNHRDNDDVSKTRAHDELTSLNEAGGMEFATGKLINRSSFVQLSKRSVERPRQGRILAEGDRGDSSPLSLID